MMLFLTIFRVKTNPAIFPFHQQNRYPFIRLYFLDPKTCSKAECAIRFAWQDV